MNSAEELLDRLAIRELIENWLMWSDTGNWDRFRTVWHDGGHIQTSWFNGTGLDFLEGRRKAQEAGLSISHSIGSTTIELKGDRALCQTKAEISLRGLVHDVECDITGRSHWYDFTDKREGHWGIVRRQPIFEKDRLDPVDPLAKLSLDQELLNRFPTGYRHLAYFQSALGYDVRADLPCLAEPRVQHMYEHGRRWLKGDAPVFL